MKALSGTLSETASANSENMENAQLMGQAEEEAGVIHNGRFPSLTDTGMRREIVRLFFYEKLKNRCQQWFNAACDIISIYWYKHFHRIIMN